MGAQTIPKLENKSDIVLPFNYLDNLPAWRIGITVNTIRLDAPMDVVKLKAALERLFELPGWKKLGGRIRMAKDGNLHHHIPSTFDQDRPAFSWSHEVHPQSIKDHPMGSKLPTASSALHEPRFFEETHKIAEFLYPTKKPLPDEFNDWIKSDRGCLVFHIHSFQDATLLNVAFSHAWVDGMGISSIIQAWAMVLAGREDEVPPLIDTDAISEYLVKQEGSKNSPNNLHLYDIRLKGVKKYLSLGSVMSDFLRHPIKEAEERTVALPAAYVESLKQRAMSEIDGQRLSEGDVLFAWRTKLLTTLLKLPPTKSVGLLQPYSLRGLLDTLPLDKAFTSNATCFAYTAVPAGTIVSESLGALALKIQTALREQRTKDQAESFLRLVQRDGFMQFGEWNSVMMGWSNWSSGNLFNTDFSGALLEESSGHADDDNGAKCTPSYVNNLSIFKKQLTLRNMGVLLGRDKFANRWLCWSMRAELWEPAKKMILENAI